MNYLIKISKETRMVYLPKNTFGIDGENLQGNMIFEFIDEFINGIGRLEYHIGNDSNYITVEPTDEQYIIPIKNIITKKGAVTMQFVITENETNDGVPVFKSNEFYVIVGDAINAVKEAPEGYDDWMSLANAKILEITTAISDVEKLEQDVKDLKDSTEAAITYANQQGDYAKEQGQAANATNIIIQGAETLRVSAENNRVSAENNRVSAENTRQGNEETRQRNEQTRITNEENRERTFSGYEQTISDLQNRINALENIDYLVLED